MTIRETERRRDRLLNRAFFFRMPDSGERRGYAEGNPHKPRGFSHAFAFREYLRIQAGAETAPVPLLCPRGCQKFSDGYGS